MFDFSRSTMIVVAILLAALVAPGLLIIRYSLLSTSVPGGEDGDRPLGLVKFDASEIRLPTITDGRHSVVFADFWFVNVTEHSVTVEDVSTSCSCTVLNGVDLGPYEPEMRGQIKVSMTLSHIGLNQNDVRIRFRQAGQIEEAVVTLAVDFRPDYHISSSGSEIKLILDSADSDAATVVGSEGSPNLTHMQIKAVAGSRRVPPDLVLVRLDGHVVEPTSVQAALLEQGEYASWDLQFAYEEIALGLRDGAKTTVTVRDRRDLSLDPYLSIPLTYEERASIRAEPSHLVIIHSQEKAECRVRFRIRGEDILGATGLLSHASVDGVVVEMKKASDSSYLLVTVSVQDCGNRAWSSFDISFRGESGEEFLTVPVKLLSI